MSNSSDEKAIIERYVNSIEEVKERIGKNYRDMDLENSELNNEFHDIILSMKKTCDDIKREILEIPINDCNMI